MAVLRRRDRRRARASARRLSAAIGRRRDPTSSSPPVSTTLQKTRMRASSFLGSASVGGEVYIYRIFTVHARSARSSLGLRPETWQPLLGAIVQTVNTLDSMVSLLVADEPRRSADRILTRLVQIHQARGGAILRPRQGQVEIWMSVGLNLAAAASCPVRWADHADSSPPAAPSSSRASRCSRRCAAARWWRRSTWRSPRACRCRRPRCSATAIAEAVLASDASEPRPALQASPAEQGRLQMLTLLERHRLEHRRGGAAAGRDAPHGLHAPAQLRDRAPARAEALQEDARGRDERPPARWSPTRSSWALVALLAGMMLRGRRRAVLGLHRLRRRDPRRQQARRRLAPERFFNASFWVLKQGVYDLLKMAIAIELAWRAFAAFPGAWRTARVVLLALAGVSTLVARLARRRARRTRRSGSGSRAS